MFARATSRSYTCLRCQHRLALRECLPVDTTSIVRRVPRRWQTSAAEAVVENEQHDEDVEDTTGSESYSFANKPYGTRRWRPAPTAKIGVDVLGKPGEILVLPEKRKRRKANRESVSKDHGEDAPEEKVQAASNERSEPKVHETLALESIPVSSREALANIARLRVNAEAAASGQILGEEQWLKYYKALSTGFTKKQLHQYILENASASDPNSPQHESNVAAFTKTQAAKDIMMRIWGLANDGPQEAERHVSKAFNMGWGKRELILGNEREWRRLLNHLTITSSPTRGWVDIAGPESWVARAQSIFQSLRKRVRAQVLAIPLRFKDALKDPTSESGILARSMLQDLVQEHEIAVTKGSEWIGYAFSSDRIARFERDLILRQKEYFSTLGMIKPSLPLSLETLDEDSAMPFYDSSTQTQLPELYRFVQTSPIGDSEGTGILADIESAAFKNLVANLQHEMCERVPDTLDYTFSPGSKADIGYVSTDFTVKIGQSLHKVEMYEDEIPEAGPESSPSSVVQFASQVPFLPEFLNQQTPHDIHENSPPIVNELLLQLTFVPSNPLTHPSLKVQATIPSTPDKTAPALTIRSVQFVFPTRTAYIALPTTPFDLKLTRNTSVPIFEYGTKMSELYAPLLGQLATQLKIQDKLRNKAFLADLNTLLDLDLSCLKHNNSSDPTTSSAETTTKTSPTTTRYALDTASLLETRTYQISELPDSPLLHYTSAIPVTLSSEQDLKESLKLEESDGALLVRDSERFAMFVKGALDHVGGLSRFVEGRRAAMTGRKGDVSGDGNEPKEER